MKLRRAKGKVALGIAVFGVLVAVAGASARHDAASADVNWPHWGNTLDQNRYSPLTDITPSNVDQLGRAYIIDLNRIIPGVKKGMQNYPIVIDGKMYITTGDGRVFAFNAATGDMLWQWAPSNIASFLNFGIVANRGVAVCDGRVFLLTLDMTIVSLDQQTGKLIAQIPIARAVPGALANYGYSETSAPICANHTLLLGAAGSEYGVRGFVMAYHTPDLRPAWPNPFWTIPPNNTEWRTAARIVGGGVVWTPVTVDQTTNTVYFGTGAATPPYYPSLRPGTNPRADSLIALDLATGKMKWWQQQLSSNQWSYDSAQPPMVYTASIGGKDRRVVSLGTMEGVWFAYDAKTGAPIYQRVKVIDNVEHPNLKPGKPVVVYPASIGGLNYSPAAYSPQTHYIYNAAAETAAVFVQQAAADAKKKAMLAGDVWLGLANGDYGAYLANGWRDYGSVSAIDIATGQRVWKFNTPEPERGGPTVTASGVGFVGGGDGKVRAFDAKTGKVLWTFQTSAQIASGPSIYSVDGKEYIAVTVGGTATTSGGGRLQAQIHVFALGAPQGQSTPPVLPALAAATEAPAAPRQINTGAAANKAARPVRVAKGEAARVAGPIGLTVRDWDANTNNTLDAKGHVLLGGKPVAGAVVSVGGWLAQPTDSSGAFTYPLDITLPERHVVKVASIDGATIGGQPLSDAQRRAVLGSTGGISVGYDVKDVSAKIGAGGNIVVEGRLAYGKKQTPPATVLLYSFLLKGKVTYADGSPAKDAVVTTRTNDRQYWTQSRPTGKDGVYTSFLVAADQLGSDPVPMTIGVAIGKDSYAEPVTDSIDFAKLKSATLNIQLPAAAGGTLVKSIFNPQAMPGAIYQGLLVGVYGGGRAITPISATWPDANGHFQLVLPASAHGVTVKFWQAFRQFFSTKAATAGGDVDLVIYPKRIPTDAPQGIGSLKLP